MKFKIQSILILILLFNVSVVKELYSENNYSGLTYSISAGPSYLSGFYDEYINNGITAGFNAYYNLPIFVSNTYFKGGFSYYSYKMTSNNDSTLVQFDLIGGAGLFFNVFSYLDLSAGVDFHGAYSNLKTYNTRRNEYTVKPAVSYIIGAMTYLGIGLGLCLLADYRSMKISEKNFSTIDLTFGLTYNYNSYISDIERSSKAEKKLTMFNQGASEFKKNNFIAARTLLMELYSIDKTYTGLDFYIKKIEEIEQNQKKADALIEQQNFLKAIPFLEGCSAYIKDCDNKLLTQRKNLKPDIPAWEADGIKFYDEKNYKGCI